VTPSLGLTPSVQSLQADYLRTTMVSSTAPEPVVAQNWPGAWL
jgi:hypothetical protein